MRVRSAFAVFLSLGGLAPSALAYAQHTDTHCLAVVSQNISSAIDNTEVVKLDDYYLPINGQESELSST